MLSDFDGRHCLFLGGMQSSGVHILSVAFRIVSVGLNVGHGLFCLL